MIFKKIKRRILNFIVSFLRPQMVGGYRRSDGKKVRVSISSSTFIDYPENLFIENKAYIGHFNFIEASNGIKIGEGVQITNYVTITTHSSHNSLRLYGQNYKGADMIGYLKGPVKIGSYTFIGPYTVVMPGTTIGKGCIIASHSFVKGNFPDFSIIAGNPAKIIGDTRKKDKEYLEQYPELQKNYDQWALHTD
jgi:acetyltransferase-like isoleucine patch superfamily enzyme